MDIIIAMSFSFYFLSKYHSCFQILLTDVSCRPKERKCHVTRRRLKKGKKNSDILPHFERDKLFEVQTFSMLQK